MRMGRAFEKIGVKEKMYIRYHRTMKGFIGNAKFPSSNSTEILKLYGENGMERCSRTNEGSDTY